MAAAALHWRLYIRHLYGRRRVLLSIFTLLDLGWKTCWRTVYQATAVLWDESSRVGLRSSAWAAENGMLLCFFVIHFLIAFVAPLLINMRSTVLDYRMDWLFNLCGTVFPASLRGTTRGPKMFSKFSQKSNEKRLNYFTSCSVLASWSPFTALRTVVNYCSKSWDFNSGGSCAPSNIEKFENWYSNCWNLP